MLRFHTTPAATFQQLLRAFPTGALASPRRSTVPLLEYWREPPQRLQEWCAALQQPQPRSYELAFEYAVPTQRGKGKASYTDLMILADGFAIGIEAKFLEPPYETVREWLGDPQQENRADVLRGWLELLRSRGMCNLKPDAARDLPYQFIHRAASAAFPGRNTTFLVYQIFDGTKRAFYEQQLRQCKTAIHPSPLRLALAITPFKSTPRYDALIARWDAGDRNLASDLVNQMEAAPLVSFGRLVLTAI